MKYLLLIILFFLYGCSDKTPELHVIGVYEGTDPEDDGKPWWSECNTSNVLICHSKMTERKRKIGGEVNVNISIEKTPIILALTAYDKTKWTINTKQGVKIKKVILAGYHEQSIQGIGSSIPVEVYTYDTSYCEKCFQGQGHFYSYKASPSQLQKITGLSPTSFQGRYTGKEFSIFPEMNRLEHPQTNNPCETNLSPLDLILCLIKDES
jgi:hypothetical protein